MNYLLHNNRNMKYRLDFLRKVERCVRVNIEFGY